VSSGTASCVVLSTAIHIYNRNFLTEWHLASI